MHDNGEFCRGRPCSCEAGYLRSASVVRMTSVHHGYKKMTITIENKPRDDIAKEMCFHGTADNTSNQEKWNGILPTHGTIPRMTRKVSGGHSTHPTAGGKSTIAKVRQFIDPFRL